MPSEDARRSSGSVSTGPVRAIRAVRAMCLREKEEGGIKRQIKKGGVAPCWENGDCDADEEIRNPGRFLTVTRTLHTSRIPQGDWLSMILRFKAQQLIGRVLTQLDHLAGMLNPIMEPGTRPALKAVGCVSEMERKNWRPGRRSPHVQPVSWRGNDVSAHPDRLKRRVAPAKFSAVPADPAGLSFVISEPFCWVRRLFFRHLLVTLQPALLTSELHDRHVPTQQHQKSSQYHFTGELDL